MRDYVSVSGRLFGSHVVEERGGSEAIYLRVNFPVAFGLLNNSKA